MSNEDTLEMIAYNTIQLVFHISLSTDDIYHFINEAERAGIGVVVNQTGRVVTFDVESQDNLADIIDMTGDLGITEEIGKIEMKTELEPQWESDYV